MREARRREGPRRWMRGLITVALATSLAGGGCNSNTESAAPTSAARGVKQPPEVGPTPTPAGEPSDARLAVDQLPEPPAVVPQVVLEAQRVAGEKNLMPGEADIEAMAASGKGTVGRFKMCLDDKGVPAKVTLLKSTYFADYDARIKAGIRAWRYKPFRVKGKPVPVCTSVDIVYRPSTRMR